MRFLRYSLGKIMLIVIGILPRLCSRDPIVNYPVGASLPLTSKRYSKQNTDKFSAYDLSPLNQQTNARSE